MCLSLPSQQVSSRLVESRTGGVQEPFATQRSGLRSDLDARSRTHFDTARKMPVTIGVKWGKNSYDVEVDTSGVGLDLKTQLFSLTGVPPERIKLRDLRAASS